MKSNKNKIKTLIPFLLLLIISHSSYADKSHNAITINKPLPHTQYSGNKNGLLVINKEKKISFAPWSTNNLVGKVHVIYHLAARNGIQHINASTIDAIDQLQASEKMTFLTLLNGDDVPFGATGMARSQFASNKKSFPESAFVFDNRSKAQKNWNLARKNSAIILTNATGQVLFYKDGKLSEEDNFLLLNLIKKEIK